MNRWEDWGCFSIISVHDNLPCEWLCHFMWEVDDFIFTMRIELSILRSDPPVITLDSIRDLLFGNKWEHIDAATSKRLFPYVSYYNVLIKSDEFIEEVLEMAASWR